MDFEIKLISNEKDLYPFLEIIKQSFITVADQFSLTPENAPTNPAFISREKLNELHTKSECYGFFTSGKPAGFFALEFSPDRKNLYLEKVSVLPDMRHNRFGYKILDYSVQAAISKKCDKISIGIIDENIILKKWYIKYGFKVTAIQKIKHLPFNVCFLEYTVN